MFFSLNKKFFFAILAFFLLSAGIFVIIFDGTIGKKIRSEHSSIIARNQYVIELLNENITLRKQIDTLNPEHNITQSLSQKQKELSYERKLNEELNLNYNENYATLSETLKIISLGASLTLLSLIILWFLLRRWVLTPINRLTELSVNVANGNFTKRLKAQRSNFTDEFDTLTHTVNFMLDNIENNINEIKEKEIFLQNLIDALPDAIRVIDENYNIVLYNKAYSNHIRQKYFSKASKCYNAYNKEYTCPCSSNLYICPLQELKKNNKHNIKLIHSINDHPLSINSARININNTSGIVESFRNLSENITYSHQQKISSLGFLATSLAHEMKNNLGAINLILEGILQKYNTNNSPFANEQKYLEMISAQIKECIKIPERLLKLARNNDISTSLFNITTNINDTLSLLDYDIKSHGIELIKSFSNTNEQLIGNETDFKMIILNLVQNAINAMPDGGTLEIKTNTNKENILIEIKDTGCGISEIALKHIFEPFYSTSTDVNKKGTGLGLAIVKDLILKFNGKITVNSKKNIGTSFQIAFPRQKAQKMLVK